MAKNGKGKSKALAKVKSESKELVQYDYAQHQDAGFENQTGEDLQIPFLALLQDDSKVVKSGDHEARTLFNTVSQESLGNEVVFVPAYVEKCFVEWVPHNKGGGFVARYQPDDEIVAEAKQLAKEKNLDFGKLVIGKNDLVETYYVYGALCLADGDIQPIVVSFSSSKIKVYRKWNTCVTMFKVSGPDGVKIRPPRFAHLVKIGIFDDQNKAGLEFYNYTMSPANGSIRDSLLQPDDPRFIAAMGFGELVKSGKARAAEESLNNAAVEVDTDEVKAANY
jgi:hypothetical protein